MYFYAVWVRSNRYHGHDSLTYASSENLPTGTIVSVELQRTAVLGFISGPADPPKFKTKTITKVWPLPPLPLHLVKLASWLIDYYPAPLGMVAQQFLPASLSLKDNPSTSPKALPKPDLSGLPKLNAEQQQGYQQISSPGTYLLHGRTGSGKTRLYIQLAADAIANDRSAIILTPEISLTAQLTKQFREVFGSRVILIHSQQTPKERRQAWLACLEATEPLVVIGPRSALFVPLLNPGLIVLDEAHEPAYKQEQKPAYLAARVAAYLATALRAKLILGSATPLVTDYYLAEQKNRTIIKLHKLAKDQAAAEPQISIVDRKDHSLFARSPYFSQALIEAIQTALAKKEQVLLYLNRRGTARLVLCENCGWQAMCPHCDIPLTYHGDSHQLRCHSCSYYSPVPTNCPVCKYTNVVFKTAGTKAIVDEVHKLFKSAVVERFDTDNIKSESFAQNYEQVLGGDIDILVGTQMLAKGLDLPRLSTVGILLADTSLYLPDFTAQERTYQLISQVLGRVGRGHISGRAVIQTYQPDHPVIKQAMVSDYAGLYKAELAARKQYLFPPYCYLLKLSVKRASVSSAEQAATELKSQIIHRRLGVQVEGPAPSFYEKQTGKYEWQLIVKAKNRPALVQIINNLPANWSYDLDPINLL